MCNHIHTIWTAGNSNLSDVVRDFKTHTSKAILESIESDPESRREWLQYMFRFYANCTMANKQFKVWTSNNHPEEIYTDSFLRSKLNYRPENPVRAGLVQEPSHYLYSSAANYENKKGYSKLTFCFNMFSYTRVCLAQVTHCQRQYNNTARLPASQSAA